MLKQLLSQLEIESDFFKIINDLNEGKRLSIFGLSDNEKTVVSASVDNKIIYVVDNENRAYECEQKFRSLGKKVLKILNSLDYTFNINNSCDDNNGLILSLFNAVQEDCEIIVITSKALLQRLPQKQVFADNILTISKGEELSYDVKEKLYSMCYRRENMVTSCGEFSIRGDIIDVFPINSLMPYRISLFGDYVESIKSFHSETYVSQSEVEQITICPATILFLIDQSPRDLINSITYSKNRTKISDNLESIIDFAIDHIDSNGCLALNFAFLIPFIKGYDYSILDYFDNCTLVIDDIKKVYESFVQAEKEFNESIRILLNCHETFKSFEDFYLDKSLIENYKKVLGYMNINSSNRLFQTDAVYSFTCGPSINYFSNVKLLASDIKSYNEKDYTVIMFGNCDAQAIAIKNYLQNENINIRIVTNLSQIKNKGENYILPTESDNSCIFVKEKLAIISSQSIFGKQKAIKEAKKIGKTAFTSIPKEGEFVVHEIHGVGKCKGVIRKKFSTFEKDYIVIEYKDGDTLYLPTEQINMLTTYSGSDRAPSLNRLGTQEFLKIKEKVKNSVSQLAIDLVQLYRQRNEQKGYKYELDEILFNEFCNSFPYQETPDQLRAIDEVICDMTQGKVMERLICGDVGYGKTEVALRAAFLAIMNGKQVAVLAPTTILSEQHYNTFTARLSNFMAKVDVLNRFKTPKEQKQIIQNLKEGNIDIICGTHRLLSKDVEFKNLGLLILDEEQRFGVGDKEKIKTLKKNVDVLSMSATPIPRTLHLSMIGARDISVIETPPANRMPVQTILTEYSEALVIDAIKRELFRNGQVLVVYNRVEGIQDYATKLSKLLGKEVKVGVAHGQMDEKTLAINIRNLYNKQTQVLVATTLIENGIDLPSANTLIIINSDYFGLSQLYQLRGRVGRSDRLGYAYFTYQKQKVISEDANKRLNAMIEFCQLGSGFKIALKDLEIRGAGNILGKEQHGHMTRVGYDMYCRILADSVSELQGEKIEKEKETKINIGLDAFIPSEYIPETENRFRLYSAISSISSIEKRDEVIRNTSDMYSTVPKQIINLCNIALIKNLGNKINAKQVNITKNLCNIEFYDDAKTSLDILSKTISQLNDKFVLKIDKMATITLDEKQLSVEQKTHKILSFLLIASKF